jgi:hypothetical protein
MNRICANDGCDNPVARSKRPGRPAIYCSLECRPASQKRRRISVSVTHEPTEDGTRPAGRIWQVQLSRGARLVTIADGLGRPSAEHLASQVSDILSSRRASMSDKEV